MQKYIIYQESVQAFWNVIKMEECQCVNVNMALVLVTLVYICLHLYVHPPPYTQTHTRQDQLGYNHYTYPLKFPANLWRLAEILHPWAESLVSIYTGAQLTWVFLQCGQLWTSFLPKCITWLWRASVPSPACVMSYGQQESWTDRSLCHTPDTWTVSP